LLIVLLLNVDLGLFFENCHKTITLYHIYNSAISCRVAHKGHL